MVEGKDIPESKGAGDKSPAPRDSSAQIIDASNIFQKPVAALYGFLRKGIRLYTYSLAPAVPRGIRISPQDSSVSRNLGALWRPPGGNSG